MSKCSFIKKDGNKCRANAMHDSKLCFVHNPECETERQKAIVDGGKQTRKPRVSTEAITLEKIEDILPFLNKLINEVRRGDLTSKSANAIGYLINIAIDALKQTDIERRLKEIENAIKLREKEL
ncbi:MAG: hypothetical protein WC536_01445 [Patescibacteria group bacterium]